MTGTTVDDLTLEKFKYILDQKKNLNTSTFKILTVYQAALGVVAVTFKDILLARQSGSLHPDHAQIMGLVLYGLFVAASLLAIALLSAGIAAWRSYKTEECLILALDPPKQWSVWKWYETYIIIGIVGLLGAGTCLWLRWVA